MRRLISLIGQLIGLHFAPDNHVVPVLRLEQYHRVEGPGFFWIAPLVERALPAVKTSLYVGSFFFEEVLSQDNIPFTVEMTVLFTFQPASAAKNAAAVLVRSGEHLLSAIVKDYTSQGLRRLTSRFRAEVLCHEATLLTVERDLARYLKAELSVLGIAPLSKGGILIKETVPPEAFKHTMLDVKHDEALLETLRSYPVPDLVELLNKVILANSFKDRSGESVLMMGLPEGLNAFPILNRGRPPAQNGNGHHSQKERYRGS